MAWHVAFMVHWDGTSVVVTAFCSAHEAFGLVCFHGAFRVPGALGRGALVAFIALVLFMKCWAAVEVFGLAPLFVAFRVLVVFMGHYGGTLVVFTVLVQCMGLWAERFLWRLLCFYC